MSGAAARTWLRLQGAGPPCADTPEPLDTRLEMGNWEPTPRSQPEADQPPYRAASALPARKKGATGFPGRTSRASGLARVPSNRESTVTPGGSASLRANMASAEMGGCVMKGREGKGKS